MDEELRNTKAALAGEKAFDERLTILDQRLAEALKAEGRSADIIARAESRAAEIVTEAQRKGAQLLADAEGKANRALALVAQTRADVLKIVSDAGG